MHFVMSRIVLALPTAVAVMSLTVFRSAGAENAPPYSSSPVAGPAPLHPSPIESATAIATEAPPQRRMPSRFQLEDPDAVRLSLRQRRPPVCDAALHSGLGVEMATW